MEIRTLRDYSSIYNIRDFINNDLAPKYFDMVDLSQHTVGLYGLTTETFATVSEDTFNVVSRFITEMLPSRATLPEFIYANAALFGITDTFAKCASMPIYFFIKESDIINHGKKMGNDQTEYRVDSDSIIYIEEIPYSLPHNIVIRTTKYRGEYIHQCTYAVDQYNNSVVGSINPYIKNMKTFIGGDVFLVLALNVYQYVKVKYHENIISNNKINIPYIDIPFENGLCNFELIYVDPETKVATQLIKLNDSSAAVKKPFVYYKLLNENTIRFTFSNDERFFKPKYNSDLYIHMYETMAEKGNFNWYKGNDIYVNSSSEDVELYYNNEVSYGVSVRGDSHGGRPNLSLDEIKYLTIEKMITVSSYTTDNDLNMHFLNSTKTYETECKFNKIRDDYAARVYGCYTMLKDNIDIYPTNTLNACIKMTDFDKTFDELGKYIIKPGTPFVYKGDSLSETIIDRDSEDEFIYTSIALISINKRPNSLAYYINSVDKSVICNYGVMNNSSLHQFIMSDFSIKRNALKGDDFYMISLTLTPSNTTNEDVELDPQCIKPIVVFETNTGHHMTMKYVKPTDFGGFVFTAKLETDDMYTNNMISLTNLIDNNDGTTDNRLVKMVDPNMTINVYYDYGDGENIPHQHNIFSVNDYTFTNSYQPVEGELYFAYPLNLSHSNIKFVPDESEKELGFRIDIENVPLVQLDFLMNQRNFKKTLDRLRAQHMFLQETSLSITSNYSINMKFYNTFGRSRLFLLSTGDMLNRVNCTLEMDIKFNDGVVVEEYIYNIKRFIKKYIESINGVNTGINQIHISSLITELHNNYPQINYIVFRSINEYPTTVQTIQIKDTSDMIKSEVIPEFLTISENDIMITSL